MLALPPAFGLSLRRLGEGDAAALQALYEACPDYHVLHEGEPAREGKALETLSGAPAGKPREDRFVIGFFAAGGRLSGMLDILRDFRERAEWYLGLLLLAPGARGAGLGASILRATIDWVRAEGAHSLRIAVDEQNTAGRRFWERHGFRPDRTFPPEKRGTREAILTEYTLRL